MVSGEPCMCMRHTGTLKSAAASRAPGARSARTSLIMLAPAATAALMTSGREVSTDSGTGILRTRASTTGMTRSSSSASVGGREPGRVDSPPMSMRSAPSAARRQPCSTARSRLSNNPPSEKESGVTLRMPQTSGRPAP